MDKTEHNDNDGLGLANGTNEDIDIYNTEENSDDFQLAPNIDPTSNKIILCEDEASISRLVQRIFLETAYEIHVVTTTAELEEICRDVNTKFLLVITDNDLKDNGKYGVEVVSELRTEGINIPTVIACTLGANEICDKIPKMVEDNLFLDFVPKPYRAQEITAAVDKMANSIRSAFPETQN